jgi:Zn finger protein HypA/HybF involved in hydrogenase expression
MSKWFQMKPVPCANGVLLNIISMRTVAAEKASTEIESVITKLWCEDCRTDFVDEMNSLLDPVCMTQHVWEGVARQSSRIVTALCAGNFTGHTP